MPAPLRAGSTLEADHGSDSAADARQILEAEAAVLEAATVIFNGRTHTMEDIEKIRAGRRE